MFARSHISIGLALLLVLVFTFPAFAGGWAVITLDELPSKVVAGEPVTIGFMVLQHGRTPMAGLYPTITTQLSFAETMSISAEPEGKTGHYVATLTFPKEGNWEWSIQAFTMHQPMPILSVAAAGPAHANQSFMKTEPASVILSPLWIVRTLAVGIGLFGLVMAYRRRNRLSVALTVLCLLVGAASFMPGAGSTLSVEAQNKSAFDDPSISQVELGQQLFIAKGCLTCHQNARVTHASEYSTIETGAPNLSTFSASPEALRLRLKNPSSVKSDTQMPTLGLADYEIEALIAFINSK
jgi:Cytochrome c